MKRGAFTLMELMISVVLIALISMYLYSALGHTRENNTILRTHTQAQEHRQKLYALFYRDLLESYTLEIKKTGDKHYSIVNLRTGNSLYDIAAPYVMYYVQTSSRKLIRLESANPIRLPVRDSQRYTVHADLIAKNVSDFNLYNEKNATAPTGTIAANGTKKPDDTNGSSGSSVLKTHLLYIAGKDKKQPLLMELAF
jgi:prepilin-type N-terminal cleavage/methylation domain-containing protein